MKLSGRLLHEAARLEKCRREPLYWLQNRTETYDEHWESKGLASPYNPFPQLPYFPWLGFARVCPNTL